MIRWVSLLFFWMFCLPLFAGDHGFSGLKDERHEAIIQHYSEEQKDTSITERKFLTGDWNGWREKWAKKGITPSAKFVSDDLGNPIGGRTKGFTYTGSLGVDLRIDFERLWGWEGVEFYNSWVWRTGENLSQRKIGNRFPVQQDFGSQTIKLNNLQIHLTRMKGDLSLRFGRLSAGDHFLQSPLYYNYVSNAFCGNPIGVFFNVPFSAYPNAQWAAYVQYKWRKKILGKVAVFNGNADANKNRYNGFEFSFNNTDGVQFITEWRYLNHQEKNDPGLPGNYIVGWYYFTKTKETFDGHRHRGNWGGYVQVDQAVYRKKHDGYESRITPFTCVYFAPNDRNKFPFFTSNGIVFEGMVPSRPKDVTAVGIAYGAYSPSLRAVQREAKKMGVPGPFGDMPQTFEAVFELNHMFQVYEWFVFQPDLQYVINPKGFGTIQDALVLGAQLFITF